MLSDQILALIASSVIKKGYANNTLNYSNSNYSITTLAKTTYSTIIEIVESNNNKTYMFCQEGSQSVNDYYTDLAAMNNDQKKKLKNRKGRITKTMFDEYKKYRNLIINFKESLEGQGDLVLAGHSLGGAVVGIAGGILDIKCILLAPVPFAAHSNWINNYTIKPVSYVNPSDPCCSDKVGIIWKAGNHIGKQWTYNDSGTGSHKINSFVEYFENRTGLSIL